jgi:hypothetical protein
LGKLLWDARLFMQVEDIFVALISLGLLGYATDRVFRLLIRAFAGRFNPDMKEDEPRDMRLNRRHSSPPGRPAAARLRAERADPHDDRDRRDPPSRRLRGAGGGVFQRNGLDVTVNTGPRAPP